MVKIIHTLISDIEALFDNGTTLSNTALTYFSEAVATNFKERFENYGKDRKSGLYLSNVGRPLRQLWFEIKSGLAPEPLTPAAKLKFLYGDILEDFLLLLAVQAGHKVERLQEKVEVDGVRGRIDCTIDDVLVDVKSASSYSFSKFKNGTLSGSDLFGYLWQLAGYSHALDDRDGAFLCVDKTLGHLCLDYYTGEQLSAYNVKGRIQEQRESLGRDIPPEVLCYGEPIPEGKSGNYKLPTGCSYCGHKFNCWKEKGVELRGFAYSNGPVYLTKIEREPNVPEINMPKM